MMQIKEKITLPTGYRQQDLLSFHGRDKEKISEQISLNSFMKGMVWQDTPALFRLSLYEDYVEAELSLDGNGKEVSTYDLIELTQHILGLNQDVEAFEQNFSNHSLLGSIITKQSGLRVPVTMSPFEALTWAILAQQISLSAAISIRRKFIQLADIRHSSGLLCYPSPQHITNMSLDALRQAGISQSKAMTLLRVSQLVLAGDLPMDEWMQPKINTESISTELAKIKGIGPWTVNYTLLRGYGWMDGSLHGDAAVRRAIRTLMNKETVTETEAEAWLKPFKPWRALLAAHLWAWQSNAN